jgi:hypothetical protein
MAEKETIEVAKSDLLAAWAVLENLAVSFDQIGGAFAEPNQDTNGVQPPGMLEALAAYITPELVKAINEARVGLGQYLSDDDADIVTDRIPYWERSVRWMRMR